MGESELRRNKNERIRDGSVRNENKKPHPFPIKLNGYSALFLRTNSLTLPSISVE